MVKIIQLNKAGARLVNREPFLVPDELELDFNNIGYNLTSAFMSFKNGEITALKKITRPLKVPDEVLFAGVLEMAIDIYYNGELVKHLEILPLKIQEVENTITATDLFSELETRIAALEKITFTE